MSCICKPGAEKKGVLVLWWIQEQTLCRSQSSETCVVRRVHSHGKSQGGRAFSRVWLFLCTCINECVRLGDVAKEEVGIML